MRKKYDKVIAKRNMYRAYCKAYDWELNEPEWNEYIKVITATIREWIIKGNIFLLPHNLGQLFIKKMKQSFFYKDEKGVKHVRMKSINWKATQELRLKKEPDKPYEYWAKKENRDKYLVVFTNEHTDGNIYQIKHNYIGNAQETNNNRLAHFYIKPQHVFKLELGRFLKTNKKIPTYYENNTRYINYGEVEKKITSNSKHRQRYGFRKYMDSIEADRDKTN